MQFVKNKRLYEEIIVYDIAKSVIINAIKHKITISDVNDFLNEYFEEIINDVIEQ